MLDCETAPLGHLLTELSTIEFEPVPTGDEWSIEFPFDLISIRDVEPKDLKINRDKLKCLMQYLYTTWQNLLIIKLII